MNTNKTIIKINNVQKYYGHNLVLNIKDLSLKMGTSYLLVGENGSGKSTLIKAILGLIRLNRGEIKKETELIGYVPEMFPKIYFIIVYDFLYIILNDKTNYKAIEKYCSELDLDMYMPISKLSKGNLQKLVIIQAILNSPKFIILDEPFNGLDANIRMKFINLINSSRKIGTSFLITTHYPKYYTDVYDFILTIQRGEISNEK